MNQLKVCSKCRMILPVSDFYVDKSCKDGLQCWCKKCKLVRAKKTYRPETRHQKYKQLRQQQKRYWIDADGYLVYGVREKNEWESVAEIPQHHVEPLAKILKYR